MRLRGSPRKLALGSAIGVFVGLTPTIPFHTILILLLCFLTGGNAIAGIILSWLVCNPLTFLPIYSLAALIGNWITPWTVNLDQMTVMLQQLHASGSFFSGADIVLQQSKEFLFVMLAGSLCMALPISFMSYFIGLSIFNRLQTKRIAKRVLRQKVAASETKHPAREE